MDEMFQKLQQLFEGGCLQCEQPTQITEANGTAEFVSEWWMPRRSTRVYDSPQYTGDLVFTCQNGHTARVYQLRETGEWVI